MRIIKYIELKFIWYDFWVGFYYDRVMGTVYFCPFPMIVFIIDIRDLRETSIKWEIKKFWRMITLSHKWLFSGVCQICESGYWIDENYWNLEGKGFYASRLPLIVEGKYMYFGWGTGFHHTTDMYEQGFKVEPECLKGLMEKNR